jgi:hypothetical protein
MFSQIVVPLQNRLNNKLNNSNVVLIPEMSTELNSSVEWYL